MYIVNYKILHFYSLVTEMLVNVLNIKEDGVDMEDDGGEIFFK